MKIIVDNGGKKCILRLNVLMYNLKLRVKKWQKQ